MTNTYYKQKYDQMMLERIPEAGKNVTSMPVSEQLYSEDGKLPIAYRDMNAPHMIVEERLISFLNAMHSQIIPP